MLQALRVFVMATKLHPILVNFTAALVPVSVASDAAARYLKNISLRATAWWTLLYATVITPFTAVAGWLFWMKDDNGVTGMAVHKWLGTSLVVLLAFVFLWRKKIRQSDDWVSLPYLAVAAVLVGLIAVQGHLGGAQTYSGM